ncbi:MAG: hypothetical protein ACQESK_00895 [Bacteroidota bacterium]
MIKKVILYSFLLFGLAGFAQEKNEVEKRIKKKEVPAAAKEWMNDAYESVKRIRWYFQTDGDKRVYEAKLRWQKKRHSIEFSLDGKIINIEIKISEDEIDTKAKRKILGYLKENYHSYSLKKIQIQYQGDNDDLEDLIDENEVDEDLEINYEIESYGRNDNDNELWEGIFDEQGNFKHKRVIIIKATDNLDY